MILQAFLPQLVKTAIELQSYLLVVLKKVEKDNSSNGQSLKLYLSYQLFKEKITWEALLYWCIGTS